jgi:hypothetical protein
MKVKTSTILFKIGEVFGSNPIVLKEKPIFPPDTTKGNNLRPADYNKFSRQKRSLLENFEHKKIEFPRHWFAVNGKRLCFTGTTRDFHLMTNIIYQVVYKRDSLRKPLMDKLRQVDEDFNTSSGIFEYLGLKIHDDKLDDL